MMIDDPHDDPFDDAPPDPDFANEQAWLNTGAARRTRPTAFATTTSTPSPASSRFAIDWINAHRTATYPTDPSYPNGVAIDLALSARKACRVELPYPAASCGLWVVMCHACGFVVALATAGRADDPHTVRLPCKPH